MERMHDCQSDGMHSPKNIPSLHQTFLPRVGGAALALLGTLGLWLFPIPGAAQIPDSFATVGPAAHLTMPPAVRVVTFRHHKRNDPTAPPQEVPFLPTMDQSVYDALKAEAEAEATAAPQLAEAPTDQGAPPTLVLDQNASSFLLADLPNTPFVAVCAVFLYWRV